MTAPSDPSPPDEPERSGLSPRTRRHLLVLGVAVVGIVVGVVLVLTGRDQAEQASPTDPVVTTTAVDRPLLPSLGSVADEDAAMVLLEGLDPETLAAPEGEAPSSTAPSTTAGGVDLSEAGLQRCQQAVAQQNTDRSLGEQRAAGRLQVGHTPSFVVTYALPASGTSPAGLRVVLVDARTCRVLGAVEH